MGATRRSSFVMWPLRIAETLVCELRYETEPCVSFRVEQGILHGGGFPSRVTAHFVEREGDARPRTTILIKVSEEVVNREARLDAAR